MSCGSKYLATLEPTADCFTRISSRISRPLTGGGIRPAIKFLALTIMPALVFLNLQLNEPAWNLLRQLPRSILAIARFEISRHKACARAPGRRLPAARGQFDFESGRATNARAPLCHEA